MRIGDIGGLAVVVLTAILSVGPIQAAAAPGNVAVTMETGGPLDPLEMLAVKEWRSGSIANSQALDLSCPGRFHHPTSHEYTIVVHVEEQLRDVPGVPNPLAGSERTFAPPLHAVHRNWWMSGFNTEREAEGVLDSLQQKLMELHEKDWFEVEFSSRELHRTELRIRYTPLPLQKPFDSDPVMSLTF